MASITDCVVEGLKYPFNDAKKVLGFGVFFTLINLLSLLMMSKLVPAIKALVEFAKSGKPIWNLAFANNGGDFSVIIGLSIIIFIISLLVMGYEWNIVKFAIDKRDDLPGLGNILDILIKGVKYFIVVILYNIIPSALNAIGFLFLNNSIGSCLILISMILYVVCYFLLIMALNNMIAYDDIKKAFDLKEITQNIANLGYGKYIGIILFTYIVYLIIIAAVGLLMSIFSVAFAAIINNQATIITVVLALINGLFVLPYVAIFYNRIFGSIYRESIKN